MLQRPAVDIAEDVQTQDIGVLNRWLAMSRLRAVVALAAFAIFLRYYHIEYINLGPVLVVCVALSVFSGIVLRWKVVERRSLFFFHAQLLVDLIGVTVGIGLALYGLPALLCRLIFVVAIVPPSLVSVRAGLLAATGAMIGHEVLLNLERGFSLATLTSMESLLPGFLFFLVAQQSFFYGKHLQWKNAALGQLAARLRDSRERLAGLVQVAQALNSTLDAPELFARVNRAALRELKADWSATFRINWTRGIFQVTAVSDPEINTSELSRLDFPMEGWPVLDRLAHERVIMITGDEAGHALALFTGARRLSSLLLAGLYRGHDVVGFLALGYTDGRGRMTGSALWQLSAIAEHTTIALHNTELLEEARQASELKSEFVSTVSHELRTPLNVIIGYADMLRDGAAGVMTPKQQELFDRIDSQARELFDLIEAILQVGRMETGRDAVTLAPVAVSELIRALETVTAGLPRPAAVAFDWDVPTAFSGIVETDCAKVALVVRNLVSNAFKFTPEGRVVVRVWAEDTHLVLTVADTGIGIDAEHLPMIFDMFRQVDPGTTPPNSGVGLGLYIVRQMVHRLKGTIDVASTPGSGTTFSVTLSGYQADAHAGDGPNGAARPAANALGA